MAMLKLDFMNPSPPRFYIAQQIPLVCSFYCHFIRFHGARPVKYYGFICFPFSNLLFRGDYIFMTPLQSV